MDGVLVLAQVALTSVLLVGAGLLIRSFEKLVAVESGFNPDNVLTLQIVYPSDASGWPESRRKLMVRW